MPPRKRKRDSGAPWMRARGFAKEPSSVGAVDAASDPPTPSSSSRGINGCKEWIARFLLE